MNHGLDGAVVKCCEIVSDRAVGMAYVTLLCCASLVACGHFVSSTTIPLKFVTSHDPLASLVTETIPDSPRQPHEITVTSKPHNVLDKIAAGDLDVDGISEQTLGAWKRWLSTTQNRTFVNPNPNEKTFTQQQIMEKLFNDYHKHLQEQNQNEERPAGIHSPWPLDTENEEGTVHPSDAMTNLKFERPHNFNFNQAPPKDGWVTMQPIPWSVSKISKWTPNKNTGTVSQSSFYGGTKPFDRPPTGDRPYGWSTERPQTSHWNDEKPQTAAWGSNKPQNTPWGGNKPHVVPSFGTSTRPQNWGSGGSETSWHEPANKPGWANVPVDTELEKPSSWNTVPKPQWGSVSQPSKPEFGSVNKPKPWIESSSGWTDLNFRPVSSRPPIPSYGSVQRPTQPTHVVNHQIGIITDGKPAEWPSDPPFSSSHHKPSSTYPGTNRPQKGERPTRPYYPANSELNNNDEEKTAVASALHVQNKPSSENGQWVLLSSTRGYTVPPVSSERGTRAFRFSASPNNMASISTNRGIRLTVLPAKDNSSVLSHGGLLEVDKSFETVDAAAAQAHLEAANLLAGNVNKVPKPKPVKKGNKFPQKQQSLNGTNNAVPVVPTVQVFTTGPASPLEVQNRKKALIAAIGAGMLPATMAALVPMFLGRRRRRDTSRTVEQDLADMLEEAQRRRLLVWHRLPRSTFNVRRQRRREAI
ncbi:hypothetical protein B566_EDAN013259 [Ephemera danica]|nr:hypothetical protein B566_EDAN013259 [Ephemera danica]